jgi:hypothetical protein
MSMSLRAIFLIGFVVAMPILALPAVARRMDEWLYGPAQETLPAVAASAAKTPQIVEPTTVERASPASYVEVDVPPADGPRGADRSLQLPDFPPSQSPPWSPPSAPAENPLAAADMDRLQQIRQQLEQLGAQYILLETTDGTGEYRFHCQMKLSADAPYTREFEACRVQPLAAAEEVLAAVRNWHAAAAAHGTPALETAQR